MIDQLIPLSLFSFLPLGLYDLEIEPSAISR